MHLEGSRHCGAIGFSLEAHSPVPFMRCHCTICRKTAGGGGCAINLDGDAATLKVRGESRRRNAAGPSASSTRAARSASS